MGGRQPAVAGSTRDRSSPRVTDERPPRRATTFTIETHRREALATVVGAATTLTYLGAGPGPVTAAVLLLVAVLAVAAATRRTVAAVPFAATALWALLWITTTAQAPVAAVAVLGGVGVLVAAALRSRDGVRAAFG